MTKIMELIGRIVDPFAPLIRPFTGMIPGPIERLGETLLEKECYDYLLRKVDFISSPYCVAVGLSRGLGWGIVLLSSVVKVPQILKVVHNHSAQGLSLTSFLLETFGYLVSTAYSYRSNFPFSAFGETVMIAIQNIVIIVLILNYSGKQTLAAAFVATICPFFIMLAIPSYGFLNHDHILYLQSLTIPLSLASKIPQVIKNHQNKSIGQLSVFTVVNYLLGSLARVFTTVQEINDKVILTSFLGAAILNAILMAQVFMYWETSKHSIKKQKRH